MAGPRDQLNFAKVEAVGFVIGTIVLTTKSLHFLAVVVAQKLSADASSDVSTDVLAVVVTHLLVAFSADLLGCVEHRDAVGIVLDEQQIQEVLLLLLRWAVCRLHEKHLL